MLLGTLQLRSRISREMVEMTLEELFGLEVDKPTNTTSVSDRTDVSALQNRLKNCQDKLARLTSYSASELDEYDLEEISDLRDEILELQDKLA